MAKAVDERIPGPSQLPETVLDMAMVLANAVSGRRGCQDGKNALYHNLVDVIEKHLPKVPRCGRCGEPMGAGARPFDVKFHDSQGEVTVAFDDVFLCLFCFRAFNDAILTALGRKIDVTA